MGINIEKTKSVQFNGLFKNRNKLVADVVTPPTVTAPSQVTADYNVKLPMGYTKIGVHKTDNGYELHEYKMMNGQKVIIMPMQDTSVQLQTYVKTGAMNEKDSERGISHFVEHMMFNGTKGDGGYEKLNPKDVFSRVKGMGGYTNACTGFTSTNYEIIVQQFNETDFEEAVKIQSAMVNNPEFTEEMIEKEKGPVSAEINMGLDMSRVVAATETIKSMYGIPSTSRGFIAGTVENIQNLNKEKITDYYNRNYHPANMTTIVTGDINPDKAMQVISKHFRSTKTPPSEQLHENLNPIQTSIRKDIITPKATETLGVLGFDAPHSSDVKELVCCDAVNCLLASVGNSRLATPLEKLSTAVEIEYEKINNSKNCRQFSSITYSTNEENSEKALKLIFDRLNNFTPPSEKELNNLKLLLKKNYERNFELPENANRLIGQAVQSGNLDTMTHYNNTVDSLTAQDIVNTVKKYYDTSRCAITVVHPEDTNQENLDNNYNVAKTINFRGKPTEYELNTKISNPSVKMSNLNKISFTGSSKKEVLNPEKLSEYKLQNNADIGFYDTQANNGDLSIIFSCDAPANVKAGTKEILELMLSKGTAFKTPQEFEECQNNNCAFLSVECNQSALSNSVAFIPEKAADTIRLMKENMLYPRFTQEEFEQAKKVLKDGYKTKEDTASDSIRKELFKGQLYGEDKTDILNSIDSITLADVIGLHRYLLQNGKAIVSVAAPISKYPELKNIIFQEINTLPLMKPNKYTLFDGYIPKPDSRVVTKAINKSQADISLGYKYKNNGELKDAVITGILTSILNTGEETGIYNNLREKEKLAYALYAMNVDFDNSSMFECNISTTTVDDSSGMTSHENVQKSIEGFKKQIDKMKNGEFTDKELKTAKLELKSGNLDLSQTLWGKRVMISHGLNSKEGITQANQFFDLIDTITKEDVVKVANHIFKDSPSYAVLANQATLDANKNYLNGLEK